MLWKLRRKAAFDKSFNSLPEAVKYEVGALVHALAQDPFDARIMDTRWTSLHSAEGQLATTLVSGYRVLWDVPDGSAVVLWDTLPPNFKSGFRQLGFMSFR